MEFCFQVQIPQMSRSYEKTKQKPLKEIKCLINGKGKTYFITLLLARDRGLKCVKSLNFCVWRH